MRRTFIVLIILSITFGMYYFYNFSQLHSREINNNLGSQEVFIDIPHPNTERVNVKKARDSKVISDKTIENAVKKDIDEDATGSATVEGAENQELTLDEPCEKFDNLSGLLKRRDTSLPVFNYRDSSDKELWKRAMSRRDEQAQYSYALRKQGLIIRQIANNSLYNDASTLYQWRRTFKEMRLFFILGVKNDISNSATFLSITINLRSPERDLIEGLAWEIIDQSMGGRTVRKYFSVNDTFVWRPTVIEVDHALMIASQYIELFDLHDWVNKDKITFPVEFAADIDVSSTSAAFQKRIVKAKDCFGSDVSATGGETKKDIIFPDIHNSEGAEDNIANSVTFRERANQLLAEYLVEIKEIDLTERKNREYLLRKSKDIRLNLLLSFKAGDHSAALLLSHFYSLETPEFDALEVLIWKIIVNKAGLISNDALNNLSDSNENILQARSLTELYINVYGLFKLRLSGN